MSVNRTKILQNIQKNIQKGNLDKAIKDLQKILEEDPKDIRTLLKIADLQSKKGELEEAIASYKQVAEFYAKDGFFLKAVAVYKQILKIDPSKIDAYIRVADLYVSLGINNDAIAQYNVVVNYFEQHSEFKKALEVLGKILEIDSLNINTKIKEASLLDKTGQTDRAIKILTDLSEELESSNKQQDLIKVLEKLYLLNPSKTNLCIKVAEYYLKQNQAKKALAKLQIAFKKDPKDAKTLDLIGQSFLELGQKDKAKSVYKELVKVYEEKGLFSEKEKIYQKILKFVPEETSFSQSFAEFKEKNPAAGTVEDELSNEDTNKIQMGGSYDSVVSDAAPEQDEAPIEDDPQKLLTEAEVYIKYGLTDKALEHLKLIIKVDPANIEVHKKIKDLYLKKNNKTAAVNELFVIMNIAENDNNREQALEAINEILKIDPENFRAKQIKTVFDKVSFKKEKQELKEIPEETPQGVVDDEELSLELDTDSPSQVIQQENEFGNRELVRKEGSEISLKKLGLDLSITHAKKEVQENEGVDLDDQSIEIDLEDIPEEKPVKKQAFIGDENSKKISTDTEETVKVNMADFENYQAQKMVKMQEEEELVIDLSEVENSIDQNKDSDFEMEEISLEEAKLDDLAEDLLENSQSTVNFQSGFKPSEKKQGPETIELSEDLELPMEINFEEPRAFAVENSNSLEEIEVEDLKDENKLLLDDAELNSFKNQLHPKHPDSSELDNYSFLRTLPKEKQAKAAPAPKQPVAIPQKPDPEPAFDEQFQEVQFFIEEGLVDSALDILNEMKENSKNNPLLLKQINTMIQKAKSKQTPSEAEVAKAIENDESISSVEKKSSSVSKPVFENDKIKLSLSGNIPEESLAKEENSFIDLAAELEAEFMEESDASSKEGEFTDFNSMLIAFKKGIKESISETDTGTHYDLGVAYKEMGLLDEAIDEFSIARKNPAKTNECDYIIGLCHIEKNNPEKAIAVYTELLKKNLDSQTKATILYELGNCFLSIKKNQNALLCFNQIIKTNPDFREVQEKIKSLTVK